MVALKEDIDFFQFWQLTYGEVVEIIQAKQAKEKERMQMDALIAYQLGQLMSCAIAINFSKQAKFPAIHELFPALFEPPEPKVQDWRIMKERLNQYQSERKKRGELLNDL